MKKILAAFAWLVLFAAAGAAAMTLGTMALLHHGLAPRFIPAIAATGAAPGLLVWLVALCFAALPGARPVPGAPRRFGLAQGLWAMGGTFLLMLCGAVLPYMAALFRSLLRILHHLPAPLPNAHEPKLILACLLASELAGLLWLIWYINRQGPAVVASGAPAGIGWRPAPARAYGAAALASIIIVALAALELYLLPPDLNRVKGLEIAQLFAGPPAIALAAGAITVFAAPLIEELLFRGIGFAGIAARLGPVWAVLLTSALFTLAHAPEKLDYLPGFAAVALVALTACGLRLRYRSVRPAILMHFLYNLGLLAVPALLARS